jgi:hypothetical protein
MSRHPSTISWSQTVQELLEPHTDTHLDNPTNTLSLTLSVIL